MINRVYNWIKDNNLISEGDTVLCAVSGGADSVVMLHILLQLSSKLGIKVHAAHFNHHIRPAEETNADEEFTRKFCMSQGATFHVGHGDIYGRVKQTGETVEEAARYLRYEFLQKCVPGAKVATAHHADDNLETMLMKMIRGCGTKGMCGIPPKRDNIIRPVLCLSREEIEEYAKVNNLKYVTDSTNNTDDYLRNRIRHHIIPLMKAENSNVSTNSVSTASVIRNDSDYMENKAYEAMMEVRLREGIYDSEKIKCLDKPIMDRVIMNILDENAIEFSSNDVHKVIDAINSVNGAVTMNFPGGIKAIASFGTLRFKELNKANHSDVEIICGETTWGNSVISMDNIDAVKRISRNPNQLMVSKEKISGKLIVRSVKDGDKMRMPGGTKSVSRVMREKGIWVEDRGAFPVICDNNGVVAVIGVGINMDYKVEVGKPAYMFSILEGSNGQDKEHDQ